MFRKKWLASILSVMMVFAFLPISSFALDDIEAQPEEKPAAEAPAAPAKEVQKEEPTPEKEATTESNEATEDAPAAKKSEANVKGAAADQSTQDGEDDISINANPKSMSIEVGKTEINNPIIGGESRDVTVKSDDETVATVVWENGVAKVTGVAEGTAKITYTLKSGTKEATDDFTVTVVASGQEYVNVTFKDFFDNPIKNDLVVKGEKATMPAGPEMEGYQFAGWKIGSGETTYQAGAQVTVNDDTVFKATYTQAKYTVSYSTSYGTVTPASQEIVAGRYASKPTLEFSGNEIKKGDEIKAPDGKYYKFLGWYNGDTEYGFNEPVVGDVTLTAKWQKVQCTVTFIAATGVLETYTVDKGGNITVTAPEIQVITTAPTGVDRNTYVDKTGYFAKKADGTAVDSSAKTQWLYFHYFVKALTDNDSSKVEIGGERSQKSVTLTNVTENVVFNALYAPPTRTGDITHQGRSARITVEVINEVTGERIDSQAMEMIVDPAYNNTTLINAYSGSSYVKNVSWKTAKFGTVDLSSQISDTITVGGKTYNVNKDKSTKSVNCVWLCDSNTNHVFGGSCGGGSWVGTGKVYVYASPQPEAGKANLIVNYCLNSASNIITSESYALDDGDTMSSAPYVNKYKSSYGEAGTPAWVTGSEGAKAKEGNTYELNIIYHTGPFKLTINYVDEEGVELEESFVQENMYRTDPYRQESPEIEGYILKDSSQAVISGQMGSSDVEIDVVYAKRTDLSYTINYYKDSIADGNKIGNTVTVTGQTFGAEVSLEESVINARQPEGYKAGTVTPNEITISVSGNNFNVVYVKKNNLSYTINYYKDEVKDANKIGDTVTVNGQTFGDKVSLEESVINARQPEGYKAGTVTPNEITISVSGNNFNVVYAKRTDLSYTINYYKDSVADGNKIGNTVTVTGQTFGAEVSFEESVINAKQPTGYSAGTVTPNEITIKVSGNNFDVVYAKRTDLSYTINYYKDEVKDANKIGETETVTGQTFGDTVSLEEGVINARQPEGYKAGTAVPDEITIKVSGNNFNVVYVKKNNLSYTINYYKDEVKDANKIGDTVTVNGQTFGDTVSLEESVINARQPEGYKAGTAVPDEITIKVSGNNFNVVYAKRTDLSYTINYYKDEVKDANKIGETETVTGQTFGDTVSLEESVINARQPEGYKAGTAVPDEITIKVSGNNFNVVYAKRTDLSYTVNYLEKGTNKVLHEAKVVGNQTYGDTVKEDAIKIAGYNKVNPTTAKITIGVEKNEITFYYTAIPTPPPGPGPNPPGPGPNPDPTPGPNPNPAPGTTQVTDQDAPKGLVDLGAWALLNLLLTILTCIMSVCLLITYFTRKKEDEEENAEYAAENEEEKDIKKKGLWRLISAAWGILMIIVFFLTEDMSLPMVFTDKWTILMIVMTVIQAGIMIMSRKKYEDEEDDDAQMA